MLKARLVLLISLAVCLPALLLLPDRGIVVARAEGELNPRVFPPVTSAFPKMTALLDVFDAGGLFVSSLGSQAFTALEDGQPIPVEQAQENGIGLQLVVAVNPGPAMAVRDSKGVSRYEKLADTLRSWAAARPEDSQDSVSLVATLGLLLNQGSPSLWLTNFTAYVPDARNTRPNLQPLYLALDLAENNTAPQGAKKAILFITPHLDGSDRASIAGVAARASQAGVRVFIWLVDSESYFTHSSSLGFADLAQATHGDLFKFTGAESLPDPESYFVNLRHIYEITYRSQITAAGTHTLAVQVNSQNTQAVAPGLDFDLDVQPPNPMLLSPPQQIVRQVPEGEYELVNLGPDQQSIQILIEFPDGFERDIVQTALYVDGTRVAENSSRPFDRFTWDLRGYMESGQHLLAVEAVDSLGLSRMSLAVPVIVTVVQPPSGFLAFFARYHTEVTVAAILLAGLTLLFIVVMGIRSRLPASIPRRVRRQQNQDPVTQPVAAIVEPAGKKLPRATRRSKGPVTAAFLERTDPDGQPTTGTPIDLPGAEMAFGTDPTQATVILDDPSVSALHARLRQDEQGDFVLTDQNSVAGTWVNYDQLGSQAHVLQHGDLIHFGKLSYRFKLRKPSAFPEPRVTSKS